MPDPTPAAGGAGDNPPAPPAPVKVDVNDPAVQAAIHAAVAQVQAQFDLERQALTAKNTEILTEKKKFEGLGKLDEVQARLRELDEIKAKQKAGEHGVPSEKYTADVEAAAQAKYLAREAELSEVMAAKDKRVAALEAENATMKQKVHRSFVAEHLVRASLPKEQRLVQDGAWDYLVDQLSEAVVEHQVPGFPYPVPRLKVGGVLVPGTGPDQLMDLTELLPLARQGKGPIPNLGFCFVSAGKGSDTKAPGELPMPTQTWGQMSEEQRTQFVREHGMAKAQDLIAADLEARAKKSRAA